MSSPGRLLLLSSLISGLAAAAPPARRPHAPWRKTSAASARASAEPSDITGNGGAGNDDVAGAALPAATRSRDGFFARLAVGSGWFTAGSGSAADRRTFHGVPLSLEAYLGGTPLPWLGIGGGFSRDDIFGLTSHDELIDGDEPDLDPLHFNLETLSLFATAYPGPTSPFYGFAAIGVGLLDVRTDDAALAVPLLRMLGNLDGTDPTGLVVHVGGGYDVWLDDWWTLGVSARLLGARLSANETSPTQTVSVLIPSLLLTLGYH